MIQVGYHIVMHVMRVLGDFRRAQHISFCWATSLTVSTHCETVHVLLQATELREITRT